MFVLCFTPLLVLLLTPSLRPFRWSRLFWTYVVPVVPFVIWYDGWISCLRAYSLDDLREMVKVVNANTSTSQTASDSSLGDRSLSPQTSPAGRSSYIWQIGEERAGLLPVTYLIGYPRN